MALIVNLRNDSSLFMKISGIEGVIVPNNNDEDKTIQWIGNENKVIQFFPTVECSGPALATGSFSVRTNEGIFVKRGDFSTQTVKMQADVLGHSEYIIHTTNTEEEKLLDWPLVTNETVVNLSFWNL